MEGPTQLCKGVDYPLSLGETMQGQLADLCYMRYEFKPASAGRQGQGQVSIEGSEVALMLPNSNAGQPDQQFRGNFEHSKDEMDCVLLFDGSSFRLEALAGRVNGVRHLRGAHRGASAAAAAQPAAALDARHSQELQQPAAVPQQQRAQPAEPSQAAARLQPAEDANAAGWTFGAAAAAATPDVAAPASSGETQSDSGSSSGSDSDDGGQPAIGNIGGHEDAGGAAHAAAPKAAALAAPAVAGGAAVPGAEELSPEELAFLGYSAPVPAPSAAAQPVTPATAGGGGDSGSQSSSDSSDSDSDDEELNRCSEDESDGGGMMEMI